MLNMATRIATILKNKGFETYFVGGYVRDTIMKRDSADIDIATSARPNDIIEIFDKEGIKTVPTGLEHGTITVVYEGCNFEITTFRKDVSCDGRNAVVKFADTIKEDLSRRDFTINAIALCPFTHRYIDPYGGVQDIADKRITTVGAPDERFKEDYLRMIRAFRFSSVLGFNIDIEMGKSIIYLNLLDAWEEKVSIERIKSEIDKCFEKSDKPSILFNGLLFSGMLKRIMPELDKCFQFKQNKYHKHDVYFHTINTLNAVPKQYPLIRWAALLHDLGKVVARNLNEEGEFTFHNHEFYSVEIANNIMDRMKFSNKDKEYIANLIEHHMFQYNDKMKDSAIRRLVASLGEEYIDDLCIMKYADRVGKGKECGELNVDSTRLKQRLKKIMEKSKVLKVKDLAIGGNEVMQIKNISPSRKVGEHLKKLYELVIERPELNTKEQLEDILREK